MIMLVNTPLNLMKSFDDMMNYMYVYIYIYPYTYIYIYVYAYIYIYTHMDIFFSTLSMDLPFWIQRQAAGIGKQPGSWY